MELLFQRHLTLQHYFLQDTLSAFSGHTSIHAFLPLACTNIEGGHSWSFYFPHHKVILISLPSPAISFTFFLLLHIIQLYLQLEFVECQSNNQTTTPTEFLLSETCNKISAIESPHLVSFECPALPYSSTPATSKQTLFDPAISHPGTIVLWPSIRPRSMSSANLMGCTRTEADTGLATFSILNHIT